jgi:hypothetical protein
MEDVVNEVPNIICKVYKNTKTTNTNKISGTPNIWVGSVDENYRIHKIISGIILIHDYLRYAESIGITEIYEVVGSDDSTPVSLPQLNKVNINDVIQKYDIIYKYCRNLCYMFTDIGNVQ